MNPRRTLHLVLVGALTLALPLVSSGGATASADPSPSASGPDAAHASRTIRAKASTTKARTDEVALAAGTRATVRVLMNDRIAGRRARAEVRLTAIPTPATMTVTLTRRRAVSLSVPATAPAGLVTITYRVRDTFGDRSSAKVKVLIGAAAPTDPPTTGTANSLRSLVSALPVAAEHRSGYDRDLFKHWNAGANPSDGCDTRREVLIAEAVVAPTLGPSCSFTGGSWRSYYDGVATSDSSTFDIDHMVALAESWDSGAWTWTPERREAYANDLGDPRSLAAVTASSNRSKSDQDPAEWLPALERCRYVAEWTVVKTRWSLSVDPTEKDTLTQIASGCEDVTLTFTSAP